MFNPDQPIKSSEGDLIGRKSFSQQLADAILSYKERDSLTMGLYGEWGSGKTSIINMVVEYIISQNNQRDKEIIVIKFNPWNFSDQNQLITQFFKQLSIALNKKNSKNLINASKLLETYSKLFKPFSYVPSIGWIVNMVSKSLSNLSNIIKNKEIDLENLDSIKKELNKLLKNQSHKIIIIIDDLDRLNNNEIRQIFQLIKSLGNFPNTRYLLSFDQKIVIKALEKVQEGSGADYLEKIIQIPFEVPPIPKERLRQLLSNQLIELKKDEKWDAIYWGNLYNSSLKYFFKNIRDINRYINCLKFGVEIVKGKVSLMDYFAITALQVFLPEVFNGIKNNSSLFVGIFPQLPNLTSDKDQEKKRCDEIINQNNKVPSKEFLEFLEILFPRLEAIYGNMHYESQSLINWRKEGRICSPEHFNFFFRLSILNQEMSLKEIEGIISFADNNTKFYNALLDLNREGKILQFIRRLQDYTGKDIPLRNIETIITVLMNLGDLFPEGESEIFGGTSLDLSRIFYQLIHRFKDDKIRFNILKNAMNKAKDSLYTLIFEVDDLDNQYKKYLKQREELSKKDISSQLDHFEKAIKSGKKMIISKKNNIEKLKKLAYNKIEVWAKNGKLAKHRNLSHILHFWKKSGNNKRINSFVRDLIRSNDGLISFISRFLIKGNRHVIGDHVGSVIWRIDIKNLKNFVNIKKIEPRIRKIYSSPKLEHLDDKEKISIKLVLDAIDGKKEGYD